MYLFLIIGVSTGFVIGAISAGFTLVDGITIDTLMSAFQSMLLGPFFTSLSFAFNAAIGYFPYTWLCKHGWGWPTKGVFVKVEENS